MTGSKNPSRTASYAKSAPAKYGGRGGGAGLSNINPRKAAKMDKSYNLLRRPTDRVLVSDPLACVFLNAVIFPRGEYSLIIQICLI